MIFRERGSVFWHRLQNWKNLSKDRSCSFYHLQWRSQVPLSIHDVRDWSISIWIQHYESVVLCLRQLVEKKIWYMYSCPRLKNWYIKSDTRRRTVESGLGYEDTNMSINFFTKSCSENAFLKSQYHSETVNSEIANQDKIIVCTTRCTHGMKMIDLDGQMTLPISKKICFKYHFR